MNLPRKAAAATRLCIKPIILIWLRPWCTESLLDEDAKVGFLYGGDDLVISQRIGGYIAVTINKA